MKLRLLFTSTQITNYKTCEILFKMLRSQISRRLINLCRKTIKMYLQVSIEFPFLYRKLYFNLHDEICECCNFSMELPVNVLVQMYVLCANVFLELLHRRYLATLSDYLFQLKVTN